MNKKDHFSVRRKEKDLMVKVCAYLLQLCSVLLQVGFQLCPLHDAW